MRATITKVLTVDDDPIFQELIKASFAVRGVEKVRQAADGAEAIAILNSEPDIDLVVCDLMMPGSNGVELMRHMKITGRQIPVIVVSSALEATMSAVETLAKAYELKLLGSLPKPLDFDRLESTLKSADLYIKRAEN